jgi:PHP family Zn ribbon phosphoesterase
MNQLRPFWYLILLPFAMYAISWLIRKKLRPALDRRERSTANRCSCGYGLDNLDRIRCPECGKVFGFDATIEELGLTDDELRRATEARERRRLREDAR